MKKKKEKELASLKHELEKIKGKRGRIASTRREKLYTALHSIYRSERMTMEMLAKSMNLSIGLVSRRFKEYVLETRSCGERVSDAPYRRIFTVRESAFDTIEDDQTAYWLGFLWADGRVLVKNSQPEGIRVVLHPRDKEHLVLFAKFLGTNRKIKNIVTVLKGRRHPQVELSVYSNKIATKLLEIGLQPHRSLADSPPPLLNPAFEGSFFRGLFDGDGHIQNAWSKGFFLSGWNSGLCGSSRIIMAFVEYLEKGHGISMYDRVKNGNSETNWRVDLSGPRVFPMLKALYPEGCFGLARKLELARILVGYRGKLEAHGVKEVKRGDGVRFINNDRAQVAFAKVFSDEVKVHYVRKKRKGTMLH